MERQKDEVQRLQIAECRLMHELQDTKNGVALEQPRNFDVVATLQAEEELREATQLLQIPGRKRFTRRNWCLRCKMMSENSQKKWY
eukprot:11767807-Prorocentrum_lima.AAC.1